MLANILGVETQLCLKIVPRPQENLVLRITTEPVLLEEDQEVVKAGLGKQKQDKNETAKPEEPLERLRKLWWEINT